MWCTRSVPAHVSQRLAARMSPRVNDATCRPVSHRNSGSCRGETCRYRLYAREPAVREQHPLRVFLLPLGEIVMTGLLCG